MIARLIASYALIAGCGLTFAAGLDQKVTLDANGWHIEATTGKGTLSVSHDGIGMVLDNVRLKGGDGGVMAKWVYAEASGNRLTIRSDGPRTSWEFAASDELLKISTTSQAGVILASAPAGAERIPARTIDMGGVPVLWQGTPEVAHAYDGAITQNISYLPRTNPDVMYFGLGAVGGSQFHSLFDKASDTAIEFTEGTNLKRDTVQPALMQVTMPVPGNTMVRLVSEYYTKRLGTPFYVAFDDSHFKSAPMVWSSWTSYYEAVSEAAIIANTDWIAANLKPYGFEYVELDDGYDRGSSGEHTWIGPWDKEKFPRGPEWLTKYIKSKGLRAGLWLVPNAYAGAVETHPDWYLHYKNGGTILDYKTPVLDSTNPEVTAFLKHLFTTLDDWGFDYYKFDGEFAAPRYIPGVNLSKLHEPSADFIANYRHRVATIREVLGPGRFIEGCPAGTPLNAIGYFNSYFNGEDLYNNWQGMHPLLSAINANAFLNHIVTYVMPGEGLELGKHMSVTEAATRRPQVVIDTAKSRENPVTGFGTTLPEARTLVTYIALTGVAYPLASVMTELPPERVELLKATMPTLPIMPMDLFSRGTDIKWDTFKHISSDDYIHNYPELIDLKVSNTLGEYDVVALTNWRGQSTSRVLQPGSQLGLPANADYLAFDFWDRKFAGSFKERLTVEVDSHDSRVLLIHRDLKRPQVLGTSRHITGAYSLGDVKWDEGRQLLSGTSQTVPGDAYRVWIHVPSGEKVVAVKASIAAEHQLEGELLTLTFAGSGAPVKWEAFFGK